MLYDISIILYKFGALLKDLEINQRDEIHNFISTYVFGFFSKLKLA